MNANMTARALATTMLLVQALVLMLLASMLGGCQQPDPLIAEYAETGIKILAGAVGWLFLRIPLRSVWLKELLSRLGQAALMVVLELKQTYVEKIKADSADGKLTTAEAEAARALALGKLKTYLGWKGIKLLGFILGVGAETLDSMAASAIEAGVSATSAPKLSSSAGVVAGLPPSTPARS